MYGRSRTREHHHHQPHYPHTDLSSLLSEGSSSTASTRERLLQGRWRRTSEDGHSERRNNRYCGSLSPHRDFSDTSSVSTLRNSDLDTCRSFSSTSSLSHWSAGPDPSRRYRPLNISRTRSFQSVQPSSPSPDRRTFRQEDDFPFDEYKSLSAQDFRKGIRREERLALEAEDDRLSSNLDLDSQDQGSLRSGRFSPTASVSSLCSFNYPPPPPVEDIFPLRHLTLLDSTNKEKLSKEVDDELTSLLRNSQSENARLKVELKALESLLESAKFQLNSTKEKVTEETEEYAKDKEEDEKVAKKMSEMEEELKMLSYSENLTDQALGQLKDDNERLRDERGSLLQVLYKLSKIN